MVVAEPYGEPSPDPIADGVERSLERRRITLNRISGAISTAVVALVLLFALAASAVSGSLSVGVGPALLLWLIGTSGLLALSYVWPALQHRFHRYTVSPDAIEIRTGVAWRAVITVPRSRVQHTDVSQGPLERQFHLATLAIYTAGTSYARVDLDGLDHARALAIRDHLLSGGGGDAV